MFVAALCILFLVKLKWPKNKSVYDEAFFIYTIMFQPKDLYIESLIQEPLLMTPYKDHYSRALARLSTLYNEQLHKYFSVRNFITREYVYKGLYVKDFL